MLARLCVLLMLVFFAAPSVLFAQETKQSKKDEKKYTNRLAKETSPYLLMHAHNPVDWYPWGPEAFAKAKKEGKLVFLSVGYSSCYWCHVMERESFSNPEIAKILNKYFVSIKVDREERPDIDNVYMTSLNVMGQNGGWPMSMFLTADGRPIFGGTYWPPEDRKTGEKVFVGFKTILERVHQVAKEQPKDVEEQANRLAKETARALQGPPGIAIAEPDEEMVAAALEAIQESFDPQYGGFGSPDREYRGPKFPTPCRLLFLLAESQRRKGKEAKKLFEMVTLTLDQMAQGGIYDQIGGGFHRYSTERTWTVPHFEKMLYDNAQLLEVYSRAYEINKKPLYKKVIDDTVTYIKREMLSPELDFYSSQDAETEEEEGRFFVWTNAELEKAISNPADLKLAKAIYGLEKGFNFEGKYYILTRRTPLSKIAKELNLSEAELAKKHAQLRQQLFAARETRIKPLKNRIALTTWSALTVAGLAEAGKALGNKEYIDLAEKGMERLLATQKTKDNRLFSTFGGRPGEKPKAAVKGYLLDYASVSHALLTLYDITANKKWLEQAEALTKSMIANHGDEKRGGYYFTANDAEKLFARSKDRYDGALPSGNSLAIRNLVRLSKITGKEFYRQEVDKALQAFVGELRLSPTSSITMMDALSMKLQNQKN